MELHIVNNAADVPFSFIVQELIAGNIEKSEAKYAVFQKMQGVTAIDLPDIEATITLIFQWGNLTIEPGIVHNPAIIIKTSSDLVTDLNLLNIRWGLPYYFDAAGRRVLGHIFRGRLKIKGIFLHLVLLTRLTIIMSVM
jgi:hypothetical protein